MCVSDVGVRVDAALVLDVADDGEVVEVDGEGGCEDVTSDGASPARLAPVDVWPVEASLVVPRVGVWVDDCVDEVSLVERVVDVDCSESGLVVEVDVCAERAGAAHSAMALNSAMMLIRCLLMMCPL
jgi:hypothetical protein